ncbi:MAG TPA: hypothetical protein VJ521_16660 [Acidobacteriota bacterium]|nr:hypothetical protein [Acidobacteriota bacterium]
MKMKQVVLFIFVLMTAIPLWAATPESGMKEMMDQPMMDDCKEMMAMQEKMKMDMQTMNSKLDQLLSEMNAAKGNKKVDSIAALLNELIAQRKSMMMMTMGMQPKMMMHMMGDMQKGMMKGMMDSMSKCPMMMKDDMMMKDKMNKN